jgi:hypothetical protein
VLSPWQLGMPGPAGNLPQETALDKILKHFPAFSLEGAKLYTHSLVQPEAGFDEKALKTQAENLRDVAGFTPAEKARKPDRKAEVFSGKFFQVFLNVFEKGENVQRKLLNIMWYLADAGHRIRTQDNQRAGIRDLKEEPFPQG